MASRSWTKRPEPRRLQLEEPLGASAALRRAVAQPGDHQSLLIEPFQRHIHGGPGHLAAAPCRHLIEDRNAVGIRAEPEDCQEHEMFDVAEVGARHWSHLF